MTIIRDDEFRKVVALHGGIQVWDTHADTCVAASLGPHERRALADALLGRKPGDEYVDWQAIHAEAVKGRDRACEVARDRGERVREANARADAAEAKVRELEKADPVEAKPRIDWRQVHDTIQVLRSQGESWAEVGKQVEFIWGLDRVEDQQAEQAVDPVEALAEELYEVGRNGDDPPWHLATENNREKHRRIARHQIERKDADR